MSLLQITDPNIGNTLNGYLNSLNVSSFFINGINQDERITHIEETVSTLQHSTPTGSFLALSGGVMDPLPNGIIHAHTIKDVNTITGSAVEDIDTTIQTINGNDLILSTGAGDEIDINTGSLVIKATTRTSIDAVPNVTRLVVDNADGVIIKSKRETPPTAPYIDYTTNIDTGTLPYPVMRFSSAKAGGTQQKSLTLHMTDGEAIWSSQWEGYLPSAIRTKQNTFTIDGQGSGALTDIKCDTVNITPNFLSTATVNITGALNINSTDAPVDIIGTTQPITIKNQDASAPGIITIETLDTSVGNPSSGNTGKLTLSGNSATLHTYDNMQPSSADLVISGDGNFNHTVNGTADAIMRLTANSQNLTFTKSYSSGGAGITNDSDMTINTTYGNLNMETGYYAFIRAGGNSSQLEMYNNYAKIGDLTNVLNGTQLIVDDSVKQVKILSGTSEQANLRLEGQGGKGCNLTTDADLGFVSLQAGGGLNLLLESDGGNINIPTTGADSTVNISVNGATADLTLTDSGGNGNINISATDSGTGTTNSVVIDPATNAITATAGSFTLNGSIISALNGAVEGAEMGYDSIGSLNNFVAGMGNPFDVKQSRTDPKYIRFDTNPAPIITMNADTGSIELLADSGAIGTKLEVGSAFTGILNGVNPDTGLLVNAGAGNPTSQLIIDGATSKAGLRYDGISATPVQFHFDGADFISATSGGTSGQHLRIFLNGTEYKIKLELP